jgi:hypothetical protein
MPSTCPLFVRTEVQSGEKLWGGFGNIYRERERERERDGGRERRKRKGAGNLKGLLSFEEKKKK